MQPVPAAQDHIHLSVVATSRNDNHGGFLTQRMQHFTDGLIAQCKRHALRAELILVEWNPPAERRALAEELAWPQDCGPCDIRIVTVPRELHARLPHGDKLPLFQMIAKNVGIRRARGRFVLATNIDILFSDEAMRFMRERLREGRLYRTDRLDVPTEVPRAQDFADVLAFCRREAFRVHATGYTLVRRDGRWDPSSPLAGLLGSVWKSVRRVLAAVRAKSAEHSATAAAAVVGSGTLRERRERLSDAVLRSFRGSWHVGCGLARTVWRVLKWIWQALILRQLFTNACGDFTLLSRADWFALRGYPEWPLYSWHLDSILLYQSHHSGLREVYMGAAARIYHIEHSPGSGFTPESSDKLFERLKAMGIPYLDWEKDAEPMIAKMPGQHRREGAIHYNDADWGYAAASLADVMVRAQRHA